MWELPKGKKFLPAASLKELERLYKNEKNYKAKLRLLTAIHRKENKSLDKIASLIHKNKRTVHQWLWKFHEDGIEAKDSKKQTGRPCKLDYRQRKELMMQLEKGPPHSPNGLWTSKEVRNFIRKQYDVMYGPTNIWNILTKSGFSVQRPRKKHHKSASIEEIKHFKKSPDDKQTITERKASLWQRKMRRHLA